MIPLLEVKFLMHRSAYKTQPAQHLHTVPGGSILVEVSGFLLNLKESDWLRGVFAFLSAFCHLLASLTPFTCSPAGAWWWVCRARESFSPASASGSLGAGCSSSSTPAGTLSGLMWSSACSSQLPRHIYYTDNHFYNDYGLKTGK